MEHFQLWLLTQLYAIVFLKIANVMDNHQSVYVVDVILLYFFDFSCALYLSWQLLERESPEFMELFESLSKVEPDLLLSKL